MYRGTPLPAKPILRSAGITNQTTTTQSSIRLTSGVFFLHAPRPEIQQPTAPPEVSRPCLSRLQPPILSSRFASRRRFPFPLQLDPFLALVRRCSHGPNPLGARCRKGACLSCDAACEMLAFLAFRLIRAAPNSLPSPASCSAAWLLASRDATSPHVQYQTILARPRATLISALPLPRPRVSRHGMFKQDRPQAHAEQPRRPQLPTLSCSWPFTPPRPYPPSLCLE